MSQLRSGGLSSIDYLRIVETAKQVTWHDKLTAMPITASKSCTHQLSEASIDIALFLVACKGQPASTSPTPTPEQPAPDSVPEPVPEPLPELKGFDTSTSAHAGLISLPRVLPEGALPSFQFDQSASGSYRTIYTIAVPPARPGSSLGRFPDRGAGSSETEDNAYQYEGRFSSQF